MASQSMLALPVVLAIGAYGARFESDVLLNSNSTKSLQEQILAGAEVLGRPGVKFDEAWFENHCDLTRDKLFMGSEYRLSESAEADNDKWKEGVKCADAGNGWEPNILTEVSSRYNCATTCWARAKKEAGHVVCCEFHEDKQRCEVRVGWQSLKASDYGTNKLNPNNWFGRQPKVARLFFAPIEGAENDDYAPMMEGEEMKQAEAARRDTKELVEQVNHLSIDGILDHMLSFYICLRWVPDERFVKLATHELQHVSVDPETGRVPDADRDAVIHEYRKSGLVPLRCGRAVHVQNIEEIDKMIKSMNTSKSGLNDAYRFSKSVAEAASKTGLDVLEKTFDKRAGVQAVDKALHYDQAKGEDSVFLKDTLRQASEYLPWETYVRPSMKYSHHVSKPKNLYMLCFGPRVASYPHKRDGGDFLMADMNTAGCNGFWDTEDMVEHLERIKKLFSPEMCFEFQLRKQLKSQFMRTFVAMNEQFQKAMAGQYSKRLHELDPTQSKKLDILTTKTVNDAAVEQLSLAYTDAKYKRFAGLMASAHSKWAICKTSDNVPSAAFGSEDNFFRDPKAYEKWLGKVHEENTPECKTLDDATGCVKCAVAVKDMYDCHIRLDVKLKDIFRAARERKYPFLHSKYIIQEEVEGPNGPELKKVQKEGTCMVRKSAASAAEAAEQGGVEAVRKAFFEVSNSDTVVVMNRMSESQVDSSRRYTILKRKEQLMKHYEEEGDENTKKHSWNSDEPMDAGSEVDFLVDAIGEETYTDDAAAFAKKFIFTEILPKMNNRPEHKVDYFVTCPCSRNDFMPNQHFQTVGSQGMAEYYNR
eukprot:TRINITY_DN729_c0_g1_i3.p1 TRINITY_DN729_c0_g1~~TRINITY_DN729_c0_g1_i3.p1  ORF type:complete len:815 (-),score=204.08 TRINITY_DN729_c0_g1_i3:371-2815(-)